jgi:16S rRNA (guanine527-N7)-methyltransferase
VRRAAPPQRPPMIRANAVAASPELAADRARALALTRVSRETTARLDRFVELLLSWQRTTKLIAASTVPHLWTRHIADSLQLFDLAPPDARVWVDLGSGGGFPGLVIACALADRPGAVVHLVESNAKKAAFLREAQRITGAPAKVHAVRIENFVESFQTRADVVTARALTSLKKLYDQSAPLLGPESLGLFPKGQDVEAELTEAAKYWNIRELSLVPSRTDRTGRIIVVQGLERRRTV